MSALPFEPHRKVALITGSAGGLGKEFARRLLKAGARVCLADINEEKGEATKKVRNFEEFVTSAAVPYPYTITLFLQNSFTLNSKFY